MKRQASIVFILINVFINVMGLGLVIPVLPKLVEALAGSVQAGAYFNGIFVAVYATMQFVFAPVLGRLSDRYGRRPVLLAASFGSALDYLIAALASTLWLLFVARVVAGILGASFSTANAYIADVSKPEERAKNFGLIGAMFGLGFILGPGIGGVLGQIDLRLPFYFAALLAFLNGLYGWFVLPESLKPENRNLSRTSNNPFAALGALLGMFLPGATGAVVLVHGWRWMARARWSRALRKALVPVSMGLSLSMLLVLIELGMDKPWSFAVMALATLLIYRGANILAVMLGGGVLGLSVSLLWG